MARELIEFACMDINGYLNRIGFDKEFNDPDLESLRQLQRQHVSLIPFETLDIHSQIPIHLQIDLLYQKVIRDRRGGYCYELNSLFHWLLSMYGFDVEMIAGRLLHGHGYGRDREHMSLIVKVDGRKWLVDVGYGDFSLEPIEVKPGILQSDGRSWYQIIDPVVVDGCSFFGVARWNVMKQDFKIDYIFTLEPRRLVDFATINDFHQTSPESHFFGKFLCTIPTENGRISIINSKLIRTENEQRQVRQIRDVNHRDELLAKYFYMDLAYLPQSIKTCI